MPYGARAPRGLAIGAAPPLGVGMRGSLRTSVEEDIKKLQRTLTQVNQEQEGQKTLTQVKQEQEGQKRSTHVKQEQEVQTRLTHVKQEQKDKILVATPKSNCFKSPQPPQWPPPTRMTEDGATKTEESWPPWPPAGADAVAPPWMAKDANFTYNEYRKASRELVDSAFAKAMKLKRAALVQEITS